MTNETEQAILDLLEEGQVFQAVKLYRQRTGADFKTSGRAVAELAARHANPGGQPGDKPGEDGAFHLAPESSSISQPFTPSAEHDLPSITSEEGMSLGALVFLGVAAAVTAWFLTGG